MICQPSQSQFYVLHLYLSPLWYSFMHTTSPKDFLQSLRVSPLSSPVDTAVLTLLDLLATLSILTIHWCLHPIFLWFPFPVPLSLLAPFYSRSVGTHFFCLSSNPLPMLHLDNLYLITRSPLNYYFPQPRFSSLLSLQTCLYPLGAFGWRPVVPSPFLTLILIFVPPDSEHRGHSHPISSALTTVLGSTVIWGSTKAPGLVK